MGPLVDARFDARRGWLVLGILWNRFAGGTRSFQPLRIFCCGHSCLRRNRRFCGAEARGRAGAPLCRGTALLGDAHATRSLFVPLGPFHYGLRRRRNARLLLPAGAPHPARHRIERGLVAHRARAPLFIGCDRRLPDRLGSWIRSLFCSDAGLVVGRRPSGPARAAILAPIFRLRLRSKIYQNAAKSGTFTLIRSSAVCYPPSGLPSPSSILGVLNRLFKGAEASQE